MLSFSVPKWSLASLASLVVVCLMMATCGIPMASAVPVGPIRQEGANGQAIMNPAELSIHVANLEAKRKTADAWNDLMGTIANNFEHLQETMNSPVEMSFFQAEQKSSSGPCQKHMNEMCNPCYKFPTSFKDCGNWKSVCHKIFCAPLCLRSLWEIDIQSGGGGEEFEAEFGNDAVKKGLEAYFLAAGCQDHLGCCPKGDMINNWAEQRAYQHQYPAGKINSCLKEPNRAKAKASCSVTVTVKPIDGACDKFIMPLKPSSHSIAKKAFERSDMKLNDEMPNHKSLRERCVNLQEEVSKKAGEMKSAFESIACACLGCDDTAECPHRITYDNSHATAGEFDSDLMNYKLSEDDAKAVQGAEG